MNEYCSKSLYYLLPRQHFVNIMNITSCCPHTANQKFHLNQISVHLQFCLCLSKLNEKLRKKVKLFNNIWKNNCIDFQVSFPIDLVHKK